MPDNQTTKINYSKSDMALDMALLIALSVIGVFGNSLIIICVIVHKKMKNVTSLFVANLAAADLFLAGLVAPGSIRMLWHQPGMPNSPWCKLFGIALFFSCAATVNFSALIALTRYIVICKSHLVVQLFRHKRSALWCIGLWTYSVIQVALPSGTQLFQYNYNQVIDVCHLNYTKHPIAIAVYINVLCFLPCVVVCIACYALIFSVLRRTRRNLQQHMGAANAAFLARKLSRERRATLPLFISLVSFFLHWLPVMILFGVDPSFQYNPQIHRYLGIFSISSACDNWIIYGILNRNFADGYRLVLCYWRRIWGAQPAGSVDQKLARRASKANHSHPPSELRQANHPMAIPLVSEEDFNDLSANNCRSREAEQIAEDHDYNDGSSSNSESDSDAGAEDEFQRINSRCCSYPKNTGQQQQLHLQVQRDGSSNTQSFELTPVHQLLAAPASIDDENEDKE
ncbi:hypothetical protein BOX15_Mlig009868g1 [Macrostomum lignano]|uniref:G-protein coupled receptors family 1 profile domain-containing protein n=1 Tax=Macrostomum lignano TaxID=282301 RepID=A0A267F882_9PLAT|nr:hypothetical protein BOX15_Mlig009868g1 [Macrostomum lignano]